MLSVRDKSLLEGTVRNYESIQSRITNYDIDEQVFSENADLREMILFPLV